mmetsp:Transcript_146337/g.364954  ORF Transcript_146337/g.364954 Transcript_146337/m.364954 type:complete len:268 (+) Transcript_146337:2480-3283(+)
MRPKPLHSFVQCGKVASTRQPSDGEQGCLQPSHAEVLLQRPGFSASRRGWRTAECLGPRSLCTPRRGATLGDGAAETEEGGRRRAPFAKRTERPLLFAEGHEQLGVHLCGSGDARVADPGPLWCLHQGLSEPAVRQHLDRMLPALARGGWSSIPIRSLCLRGSRWRPTQQADEDFAHLLHRGRRAGKRTPQGQYVGIRDALRQSTRTAHRIVGLLPQLQHGLPGTPWCRPRSHRRLVADVASPGTVLTDAPRVLHLLAVCWQALHAI